MKRTYLARRNSLLSRAQFTWGAFALLFSVCALVLRIAAPNVFFAAAAPLERGAAAAALSVRAALPGSTAGLAAKYNALASENAALAIENRTLVQKDADLMALLSATSSAAQAPGVVAGVLAAPPEDPYGALMLAAGTRSGVSVGMEVFGNKGVPVGVVSMVLADQAQVTLFSSPGQRMNAWIGQQQLPVVLAGAGAGAFSASVPSTADVTVGDAVYAPGPGALPVGQVVRIDRSPSSPSAQLRIAPAANPFSLAWVVLRPGTQQLQSALSCATSTHA